MRPDEVQQYKKSLWENVFVCMELMKTNCWDVMIMPVKRFHDLLKWKADLEEERQKIMKENLQKQRSVRKK